MISAEKYEAYVNILREELVPAMGCTEPISLAYAAALARETLGALPSRVEITVSGNILKNVKGVVVPNTGGMKGVESAAAAGIVAGKANAKLEVLSAVDDIARQAISDYLKTAQFTVEKSRSDCIFDIGIRVFHAPDEAFVRITGHHTNVVTVEKNGEFFIDKEAAEKREERTDALTVEGILEFADTANLADVEETLERQIAYNSAIAEEGLRGDYGANVGKILLQSFGNDVHNLAKATAAAGSDARMNGCNLPVVIVSGSGNQGMTASLPVVVYAKHLSVSRERLLRALLVSNLVTVHLKAGIGRLSAYCGAVSAGCGAGAGICYLRGGSYEEVARTVRNALAINSGLICDGAKSSCAAKIASAVEAGLVGMELSLSGSGFSGGDGILADGVEGTIENVGDLARNGMRETDEEIIRLMIKKLS
ncbi:MAG: L-serine ammonia-lyase, iron-sulfur-dependent, subunit alpha [Clostridiales bacterium]|nr:L-serine ammonia-lyase, iron-sulfur-dependent, subunit alpha [Clostridiales bacterium]